MHKTKVNFRVQAERNWIEIDSVLKRTILCTDSEPKRARAYDQIGNRCKYVVVHFVYVFFSFWIINIKILKRYEKKIFIIFPLLMYMCACAFFFFSNFIFECGTDLRLIIERCVKFKRILQQNQLSTFRWFKTIWWRVLIYLFMLFFKSNRKYFPIENRQRYDTILKEEKVPSVKWSKMPHGIWCHIYIWWTRDSPFSVHALQTLS